MSDKLFSDDTTIESDGVKEDAPFLDQLVGDGKKYKEPEALAKAVVHKDRHIAVIEEENRKLREEVKSRTTLDDFMTELRKSRSEPSNRDTNPDERKEPNKTISETDIETIFERKQAETVRKQNFAEVKKTLAEKWGPNYGSELKTRATDLGLTEEAVVQMAQENPRALYRLVGADQNRETLFSQPQSRINTDTRNTDSKKNWKYYEKLRVSDPKNYFSTKLQKEILRDAEAQGESFYS